MSFFRKKAQGATEYLVITAIVLIIAVGAVALSGVSFRSAGDTNIRAVNVNALTGDLALKGGAIGPTGAEFLFSNRVAVPLRITLITIDDIGYTTGAISRVIGPGEDISISAPSITQAQGEVYTYDMEVTYTKESESVEQVTEVITIKGVGST